MCVCAWSGQTDGHSGCRCASLAQVTFLFTTTSAATARQRATHAAAALATNHGQEIGNSQLRISNCQFAVGNCGKLAANAQKPNTLPIPADQTPTPTSASTSMSTLASASASTATVGSAGCCNCAAVSRVQNWFMCHDSSQPTEAARSIPIRRKERGRQSKSAREREGERSWRRRLRGQPQRLLLFLYNFRIYLFIVIIINRDVVLYCLCCFSLSLSNFFTSQLSLARSSSWPS